MTQPLAQPPDSHPNGSEAITSATAPQATSTGPPTDPDGNPVIPQAHGGALLAVGKPGHRGFGGRRGEVVIPAALLVDGSGLEVAKQIARGELPRLVRMAVRLAKARKTPVYDRIRCASFVAQIASRERDEAPVGKPPARVTVRAVAPRAPGTPEPGPGPGMPSPPATQGGEAEGS